MRESYRRRRTLLFQGDFETQTPTQAPLQKMSRIQVQHQMVDEESDSSSSGGRRRIMSDKVLSDTDSNTFLSSLSVSSAAVVGNRIITARKSVGWGERGVGGGARGVGRRRITQKYM